MLLEGNRFLSEGDFANSSENSDIVDIVFLETEYRNEEYFLTDKQESYLGTQRYE